MATGWCIMARSSSASSIIAAIACADPKRPVDLWITPMSYPQPHRPNNYSSRYERNRKTVTHVVVQICYLCCRLLNRRQNRSLNHLFAPSRGRGLKHPLCCHHLELVG